METDYLVVGAGAMGMAFTDALLDHAPEAHVTLVDRRHAPGGHWRDAYPFVQLHQASLFYGVASTELGHGELQRRGPELGLQERARVPEILGYFDRILHDRFEPSGRVTFLAGSDHRTEGADQVVTSHVSGGQVRVVVRRRVVDATYLAPKIPATAPPPFGVADDAPLVTVNHLASLTDAPERYVVVGSGKTATDAVVWLLGNGVDPERISWVRPREPWMLDRATVQPDPVVAFGSAADTMAAAADAQSLDDLFLRLEAAGVMVRIDRSVLPTMARTPTLGRWELDLLRSIEQVVRLGRIRHVARDEIALEGGRLPISDRTLVVHCAGEGLPSPARVPIWSPGRICIQTSRAGFPCFNAALIGYVEATRDDDRERNRLCPPNLFGNSLAEWAQMQAVGATATAAFGAEPDIAAWAGTCALNPARASAAQLATSEVRAARARLAEHAAPGVARLAELAGAPS